MDRTKVQSSNVAEIGYNQATMTLEVLFHNGSIYHYFGVPKMVFNQFLQADSKGGFLHREIKNRYRYTKL